MAATDGTAVLAEIINRLSTLDAGMSGATGGASRVAQLEIQVAGNSSAMSNIASKAQEIETQVGGMMDAKIAAAVAAMTASGGVQTNQQHKNWSAQSILESKAIQDND